MNLASGLRKFSVVTLQNKSVSRTRRADVGVCMYTYLPIFWNNFSPTFSLRLTSAKRILLVTCCALHSPPFATPFSKLQNTVSLQILWSNLPKKGVKIQSRATFARQDSAPVNNTSRNSSSFVREMAQWGFSTSILCDSLTPLATFYLMQPKERGCFPSVVGTRRTVCRQAHANLWEPTHWFLVCCTKMVAFLFVLFFFFKFLGDFQSLWANSNPGVIFPL